MVRGWWGNRLQVTQAHLRNGHPSLEILDAAKVSAFLKCQGIEPRSLKNDNPKQDLLTEGFRLTWVDLRVNNSGLFAICSWADWGRATQT